MAENEKTKKILEVKHLSKDFPSKKVCVHAVSDVSFEVNEGETIGIVGESGCGKTTMGRCVVRAIEATSGEVLYHPVEGDAVNFLTIDKNQMKVLRKDIQMIFQNPYSSLDPRMTVVDIIKEPLMANFPKMPKAEMEEKVMDIAAKVGLNVSYLKRYPHAFSGGQRQRIGIARALVLKPRVIVCDEAVSALDVSIQAQVINLLKDLQREMNLTYIFISHDLSVVEHISDKVGVMYLGKMVEYAETEALFSRPKHPYTEALMSADGQNPSDRRDSEPCESAQRLLFPYPLPLLSGKVQGMCAGVPRGGAGPLCCLPLCRGIEVKRIQLRRRCCKRQKERRLGC